jgi:hypothetical protein
MGSEEAAIKKDDTMDKLSEKEYSDTKVQPFFEKYFYIQREVRSVCKKGRLDYVLQCKKSSLFFGVELKRNKKLRGWNLAKNVMQCQEYTKMEFQTVLNDYPVKMPIFIMPGISMQFIQVDFESKGHAVYKIQNQLNKYYRAQHDIESSHHNLNSFIGTAFGVGEVKKVSVVLMSKEDYINPIKEPAQVMFILNNKIIWSENEGVRYDNYYNLLK